MRLSSLVIFFLLLNTAPAQQLQIEFKDTKTNESIPNVRCQATYFIDGIKILLNETSSREGKVNIKLSGLNSQTILLEFDHSIYIGGSKSIVLDKNQDTTILHLFLKPLRVQEIKDVLIKPSRPDTVFASSSYSVSDFEMGVNGELFLLTYEKNIQKDAQLQCIWNDTILFKSAIPHRAEALLRDFRGNVHVQTDNQMYGMQRLDSTIILRSIPKDYYFKYIAPIVDTSLTRQFYSSYMDIYPAFEYGYLDLLDSTYKEILHIQDDLMMELYRSEYKWVDVRTKLWAKNLENQTGIDAEIYVGANYFTNSIYYEPVYAPLFLKNDSIYIFDYPKDMLRVYSIEGKLIKSIPIYHHYHAKQSGFQKNLQQDRITGFVYALFEQDGYSYVARINLSNGQIQSKVKLAYRYVDKVRIHNNAIYFVYRPFESTQKRFLYKQKLPAQAP